MALNQLQRGLPGLIDRVLNRIGFRSSPLLLPSKKQSNTSDVYSAIVERQKRHVLDMLTFGESTRRRDVVRECRQMYECDSRCRRLIGKFADDATMGSNGLTVIVKSGVQAERAKQIADDLLKRIDLKEKLPQLLKKSFVDGELFLEVGVGISRGQSRIEEIHALEALWTLRNTDYRDKFQSTRKAFWFGEEYQSFPYIPSMPRSGEGLWYPLFLLSHSRWDHQAGAKYGTPMFIASRKPYKYMTEGELDIAIRRKTRAGLKVVHTLEGATEPEIEAYKLMNQDTLNDPFSAVADYFVNRKGSVTTLSGDQLLDKIDDILHHQETFGVSSALPLAAIGFNKNINRDILKDMMESYQVSVDHAANWVLTDIVKPLLVREWLLHGILPEGLNYSIERDSTRRVSPSDVLEVSRALNGLIGTGLFPSSEMLLRLASHFIPQIELDEALQALSDMPAQPDEVDRMATLAGMDGQDG